MALKQMTYEDYELKFAREARKAEWEKQETEKLISWFEPHRFKYWLTLTYRSDIDQPLDRCMKDIKHLKNVIHKKLFGRQKFGLDFFPVVETKKPKGFHSTECKGHFHILVGELPKAIGPDDIVYWWLKMKVSGEVGSQEIQIIDKENISAVRGLVAYQLKLKQDKNSCTKGDYDFWDVDSYTKKVSMS